MSKHQFTVHEVIIRALELGIELQVVNGELKIQAPKGVVTPKILQIIKAHKAAIIQEMTPLCATCLDEGKETPALPDHHETYMYCAEHHPAHKEKHKLDQKITVMQQAIDGLLVPERQPLL